MHWPHKSSVPGQEVTLRKGHSAHKVIRPWKAALELGSRRGYNGSNYNSSGGRSSIISSCFKGNNLRTSDRGELVSQRTSHSLTRHQNGNRTYSYWGATADGAMCWSFEENQWLCWGHRPGTFQITYIYSLNSIACEDKCFCGNKKTGVRLNSSRKSRWTIQYHDQETDDCQTQIN